MEPAVEDMDRTEPTTEETALAESMLALIDARFALETAKSKVPSYTGNLSPRDYYSDELAACDLAVIAYADAVRAVCKGRG